MVTMRTVEDAYQDALKVEEKLARNKIQRSRGRSPHRGKGIVHDKAQKPKSETGKFHNHTERGGSYQGRQYGGRNSFPRGRGRGRGGEIRCYACGKTRHMSWECLEKNKEGGEAHISEV
jgi:hypothetical protein